MVLRANNRTQLVVLGLAAAATISFFVWFLTCRRAETSKQRTSTTSRKAEKEKDAKDVSKDKEEEAKTSTTDEKVLHLKIEELDKKGKALFKEKKFLEAAQAFTDALDLIQPNPNEGSSSLQRQAITLMNNRSAMYEKANMAELALEDCNLILEQDINHNKARMRKLRLLEGLKRWNDALVEVCAIQLLYMKANRDSLRMGYPVPPPPVPQSKMEDILGEILPQEIEQYVQQLKKRVKRTLPSDYTILQLLKSYSGYHAWMAKAAKDGSVENITAEIPEAKDTESSAKRATMLMKRGQRHVYDGKYGAASKDFEEAYALVESNEEAQAAMEDDSYARLLEWTGMARHWHYELDSALACYQKCSDLEPMNALVLVKQAGVHMDSGKPDAGMKLFDMALGIDPAMVDAMFHRSNLKMIQGKPEEAKKDLERCIQLRPNHSMARLRLASILAAMNDPSGAKVQLDMAEQEEPNSSEIHSYRGELYFTQGKLDEAKKQFDKAIKLDPTNPTPYVNSALAVLNTPVAPGQIPDAPAAIDLLEKAIEADPGFTAAYLQLGQLSLGTATDLTAAREVIKLYDLGLENCRSPEEIKELCSMRVLAVAQVDAASNLGMETFSMQ